VDSDPEGTPSKEPHETSLLVRRAFEGEPGAFDELHQRVAPSLYVWVHHRMGPTLRRACDPDDVLQEVWQRAYIALPRHDPARAPFRRWIFGVAKNVLLEVIRHSAHLTRTIAPERPSGSFGWSNVSAKITAPLQRVVRDDSVRQILAMIAELPADDQELAVRCGLEGATCEEVGLRLGINREAATKRWQRLRERLRGNPRLAVMMDG
jgi:RNA polymerase sigma factor (sigma-70 family)